jgi:hypothetical protein
LSSASVAASSFAETRSEAVMERGAFSAVLAESCAAYPWWRARMASSDARAEAKFLVTIVKETLRAIIG